MSTPHSTRQWILAKNPVDLPILEGSSATFKLQSTELPSLQDDQVLVKTLYLSNDPAQRGWISISRTEERSYTEPVQLNSPMHALALVEVVESKSPNIKVGVKAVVWGKWTEFAVVDAKTIQPLPELPGGLSVTHYLGALGGTGVTAYYGLKIIAEATEKDSVVVSGAAGATGSMVVQIAKKMIGCKRVIGIAGSSEKCKWVESLGADLCLNYKDPDFADQLIKATDGFIEVYFDNVGGEILDLMLTRMARNGRIAACGAISGYNTKASEKVGIKNWSEIITMRLQVRGFIVVDYLSKRGEVIQIFIKALQEGKLTIDDNIEQVVPSRFEDIPKTWMTLFEGGNKGKLVTKLVQETSSSKI